MRPPRLSASLTRLALHAAVALSLLGLVVLGPHTGLYRTLTVLSGSMEPTIPRGSVLIVTPQPLDELRAGQVITYHTPEGDRQVVTHRVVEILESGATPVVRTKGDANAAADPWIARLTDGPVWTAHRSLPHLGYAIGWLRHPAVHIATVWIAPALLAASWLWRIWRAPADPRRRPALTAPAQTSSAHALSHPAWQAPPACPRRPRGGADTDRVGLGGTRRRPHVVAGDRGRAVDHSCVRAAG